VRRVDLGICPRQRPLPISVNDAKHVVVGKQVVKAQLLDGETDLPDDGRMSLELGLRVDDPICI
jgi:hypothetical protein